MFALSEVRNPSAAMEMFLRSQFSKDIGIHVNPSLSLLHLNKMPVAEDPSLRSLSPIDFSSADQSLLDTLLAPVRNGASDPDTNLGRNREDQVKIFAKQLITALQYMHHRNIVHLDLRPEAILLQDDHLRLADFGQSRNP